MGRTSRPSAQANRAVAAIFARQHQVITRQQALAAGYPRWYVDRLLASGEWLTVFYGLYRPAAMPLSERGRTLAACLTTGGRASHQSAGRLWELLDRPPARPVVSVGRTASNQRSGIIVHRVRDLPQRAGTLDRVPCTDAARTVLDLAAVLPAEELDAVVDRAVARRLVAPDRLEAALDRRGPRRGSGALRRSLRRGYVGGPTPSVLETRFVRLVAGAHLAVRREHPVVWDGAAYRLDFLVEEVLPVEVDGYAYHSGAADLRRDRRRRNQLWLANRGPLVYTWWDVVHEGQVVVDELR